MESTHENDPLSRRGLVVLDIEDPANGSVVKLGGEIVIDARKKITPQSPKGWVNPKEMDKLGEVYSEVRAAFASGRNMNEALLKKVQELGFDAKEAMVVGNAPEHWKPTNRISQRYVRK